MQLINFSMFSKSLHSHCPDFYQVFKDVLNLKKLDFYHITIPFGESLIINGKLNPNLFGGTVPEDLRYSSIPLAFVMNGSCEAFVDMESRIIPLNIILPGDFFGIFETLSYLCGLASLPPWSVTSGARSCFILQKISNATKHAELKKEFGVTLGQPNDLSVHQSIFKDLSKGSNWKTEVVFFPEAFLKSLQGLNGEIFKNYIFGLGWKYTEHMRANASFDFFWNSFFELLKKRNIKPNVYIMDTLKHLVAIGLGNLPGFREATDARLMDFNLVKDAYETVYGLDSKPIIFEPRFCRKNSSDDYVYYSLGYPTLYHGSPVMSQSPTNITDLRDLKTLANLLEGFCKNEPMAGEIANIRFEFFHTDEDKFGEVRNSDEILEPLLDIGEDLRKPFPKYWQFGRGCVEIRRV